MSVIVSLLTLAVLAQGGGDHPPDEVARFALVVGHNGTDDPKVAPLRYADDDALATFRLLQQADVQAVVLTSLDEDSQRLDPNAPAMPAPTRANVLDAMEKLRTGMLDAQSNKQKVEFFFFYSGPCSRRRGWLSSA